VQSKETAVEGVDAGHARFRRSVAGRDGSRSRRPSHYEIASFSRGVKKAGEEAGFEQVGGPYLLRRAAGKELDNNGTSRESVDMAS
jgi:hypothetical protein